MELNTTFDNPLGGRYYCKDYINLIEYIGTVLGYEVQDALQAYIDDIKSDIDVEVDQRLTDGWYEPYRNCQDDLNHQIRDTKEKLNRAINDIYSAKRLNRDKITATLQAIAQNLKELDAGDYG